jgi:hypothetical protein
MKKSGLYLLILLSLSIFSCLDFGLDYNSTEPSYERISQAKQILYLQPQLEMEILGMKYLGSGIDDALWFAFHVSGKSMEDIFLPELLSMDVIQKNQKPQHEEGLDWWNDQGENWTSYQYQLPLFKYLTVYQKESINGSIFLIFWHES